MTTIQVLVTKVTRTDDGRNMFSLRLDDSENMTLILTDDQCTSPATMLSTLTTVLSVRKYVGTTVSVTI